MKKIGCILLSALLFAMVGCGAPPPTIELDGVKPWETAAMYEKTVYRIDRYRMIKVGKETVRDGEPIATGTVEMVLRQGTASAGESAVMEVATDYTLTYVDDERAGIDRGKTDEIETLVTFRKTGMVPLTSYRDVRIAVREDQTDLSYTVSADYAAGTAERRLPGKAEPDTLSMKNEGTVFDNEQLFYVTRAFKGLEAGASVSFSMVNLHDCFQVGYQTYAMSVSCAAEKETLYIGEWATALGLESDGNGHAKVECLKGTIGKTGNLPGPPMTVYYSNQKFSVGADQTAKVIVSIINREYNASAVESFNTVYTLSDYATAP